MCILTFTHAPSQHHLNFKSNHSSVEYCLREIFFIKLVFDIHSNSASKHTFLEELNSLRIIIINARSYFIVLWRGISTGPLVIVIHSTRAMNYFLDKSSKHNCDEANDPAPRNSASRGRREGGVSLEMLIDGQSTVLLLLCRIKREGAMRRCSHF